MVPHNAVTTFTAWLKRRRHELDLTQEQLAALVGCAPETLRKIEAGRRRPSQLTAARLARSLELAPADQEHFLLLARRPQAAPAGTPHLPPATQLPGVPLPPTPMVGRDAELAQLQQMLRRAEVRLITILGPGGVGKTRLALAAAHGYTAAEVVFAPLAALTDPALLPTALTQALQLPEGNQSPLAALTAALQARKLLLLLDNCEQLLAGIAWIANLLAACPQLRILATSREPLRLRAEHEFPLEPLQTTGDPQTDPAVALFSARAAAVRPHFALNVSETATVTDLCARLDRLPLAIELAAARVRTMNPATLLARLQTPTGSLDLLADGPRDVYTHQRSLRATVAWSYALLDTAQQRLFARLAVFADGWTLELAEAVCAAGADAEVRLPTPLSAELDALVECSLVQLSHAAPARYRMLETIRAYAVTQFAALPEAPAVQRRHAETLLRLAETQQPRLLGSESAAAQRLLDAERENFRAALSWALHHEPAIALGLATALAPFWTLRGALSEGREWLERTLAACAEQPAHSAGQLALVWLLQEQQDYAAASARLASALAADHPATRTATALQAAWLAYNTGDFPAAIGHCETVRRDAQHPALQAEATQLAATVAVGRGDNAQADALFAAALAQYQALGDLRGLARVLGNSGMVAYNYGAYQEAVLRYSEALAICREQEDQQRVAILLNNVGNAHRELHNYALARQFLEESLGLRQRVGARRGVATVNLNLGLVDAATGDLAGALTRLEASLAVYRTLDARAWQSVALSHIAQIATEQGDIVRAAAAARESIAIQQRAESNDTIVECLIVLAYAATDRLHAARLLGAAAGLLAAMDARLEHRATQLAATLSARLRTELGEDTFARERARGERDPRAQLEPPTSSTQT